MDTDTNSNSETNNKHKPLTEIWKNLEVTDQEDNRFRFSHCRNRHIIVLGRQKTANHIVGDLIVRDKYTYPNYIPRKSQQKTITYVTVKDDPSCNICIINLIDIPPIEYFIKQTQKKPNEPTPSPINEIDKTIHKFATNIDFIILVCGEKDYELMKSMKVWALNRGYIMALVFIVNPNLNMEQREEFLSSIRNHKEFVENNLEEFYKKGLFCISDLSYNFRNEEEQKMAQNYVIEWRSKFLRTCIGNSNDQQYEIVIHDENQTKRGSCSLS